MKPAIFVNTSYAFFAECSDLKLTQLEQVNWHRLSCAKKLDEPINKVLKRQAFER